MEEIHGVTFVDFACASANIVGGMSMEKVCEVLGIEQTVWEQVSEGWANKMGEMSHEDMKFYGEVFTNPKQGKFENVEGAAAGPEKVLAKYPEWEDSLKMGKYMEYASAVGVDIDLEKEFGITLTEYSQLSMHWSAYYKKKVIDVKGQTSQEMLDKIPFTEEQIEASRIFNLHGELTDKWDAYYSEKYKDQSAGITDDIDF